LLKPDFRDPVIPAKAGIQDAARPADVGSPRSRERRRRVGAIRAELLFGRTLAYHLEVDCSRGRPGERPVAGGSQLSTVIIIDDQSVSRMILAELIRSIGEEISVEAFSDPVAALDWVRSNGADLVLTDFKMPHMDGVEFTQWLRQIPACSDVPVVVITCVDDKSVRYRALEAGATDFLSKPIDHYECRARCRNLLKMRRQQSIIRDRARWLEEEIRATTRALELREKETLLRLARAGEYRDADTGNHVVRMARYVRLIAETMGLEASRVEILEHAAPMHDIGKIGIPDRILLKPSRLAEDEWVVMQTHARIGYEILRDSPSYFLRAGAVIALGHHERYDGSGYPGGLRGERIPLEARIVAVADVFDALSSPRPYKGAWRLEHALDYLSGERGRQFDPECVDAFMANLEAVTKIAESLADELQDEETDRHGQSQA
jgi:two-component system response regulator RpfG